MSTAQEPFAPWLLGRLDATAYGPSSGAQFLTRDPLVAITKSAYGYVGGDPLNRIDPTGLSSWSTAAKLTAAVAIGVAVGVAVVAAAPVEAVAIVGGAVVVVGTELTVAAGTVAAGATMAITYEALNRLDSCVHRARRADDLPGRSTPNDTRVRDNGRGEGQIRDYGPDGRAQTDYDFGHDHGAGDPHAHDWD